MPTRISLPSLIACILCVGSFSVSAQYIKNFSFNHGTDNDGIKRYVLTYDLIASSTNIPSEVRVKLTTKTNTYYLKEVSGDTGPLVFPGMKKTIRWDYVKELVHFDGDILLNIEVTPSIEIPEKIKKKRKLPVTLSPFYVKSKSYAMKLYRNGTEVARLNDMLLIDNTLSIELPRKTKTKKGYQLVITDGENTYYSNNFKIKSRLGAGIFIWPIVAGGLYYAYTQYQFYIEPIPKPPSITD